MANLNSTPPATRFKYICCGWGDLIYGTKEQLQSLGIGIDVPFPDNPRRAVTVNDPRGFQTKIRTTYDEGIYTASIRFPGRDNPKDEWLPFAQGVNVQHYPAYDEFIGTAEALYAAGLAELDQFPGQPGMGKVQVTFDPNGVRCGVGKPAYVQGSMTIKRVSKTRYTIYARISEEESESRLDAHIATRKSWEAKIDALPRPAPLTVTSVRSYIQEKLDDKYTKIKQDKKFQHFLSGMLK